MTLKEYIEKSKKNNNVDVNIIATFNEVLCLYEYGSNVYGYKTNSSDNDYIMILTDDAGINEENIKIGKTDLNIYSDSKWAELCNQSKIPCIECYSLRFGQYKKHILKENKGYIININVVSIRKSVSSVVSNAWSKAHKKLTVSEDYSPYIGKKSLWHCIRILLFGIDIHKHGYITDFSLGKEYYPDIVLNENNNWEDYKKKYKPILNRLQTEFRKYSESEWIIYKNNNI